MSVSVSDNYRYWDNTEAVTFRRENEDGASVIIDLSVSKRLALDTVLQELGGATANVSDSGWLLPAALLTWGSSSVAAKPFDSIIDSDGNRFEIVDARERRNGTSLSHYVCLVRPSPRNT